MRFFFSAADFAKQPFPAKIKLDLFGDYGEEDQYAHVYFCKGDVPKCDKNQAGFINDFKILGEEPSCNTRLTPAHSRKLTLKNLPKNTALTVTVQLTESVKQSTCAKKSPRVVVSLGNKNCCGGACVDLTKGIKNSEGETDHCGTCGNNCESNEACCNGKCVDVASNDNNCGTCGKTCKGGTAPRTMNHTKTGQVFLFRYTNLPAPTAQSSLRFLVEARGDFNSSTEYGFLQAYISGKLIDMLDEQGRPVKSIRLGAGSIPGPNCHTVKRTINFTPKEFSGGNLTLQIRFVPNVTPNTCITPGTKPYVRVYLNPERCCKGKCGLLAICSE